MSVELKGKVALVTGSNRGIGETLVDSLLRRGAAKIYATARRLETVESLADRLGDRVRPLALDVTDPDQVREVSEIAQDTQVLINNAGYAEVDDFAAGARVIEGARREFEVNYFGPLQLIQAFAPHLSAQDTAVIVNIISVGGLVNFPFYPTYSDSKAAAHSLTTGARLLLADRRIQVVGVYPGPVDTAMSRNIDMEKASPAAVAEAILDGIESGLTDIFPDAMAQGFSQPFEAGAKTLERNVQAMMQPS